MTAPKALLGNVVEILSGFAFKSELFNDSVGMPLIRIRDVVRGYSETLYSGDYPSQYIVNNGDIVIGMDGNFNAARWSGGPALLNQRVCRITPNPEKLDDSYLFHFLPAVLKKIEDATPFVTVKHLSAKDLNAEEIPLPPLPEQRRIAAILDQADALRAKRREALAELDQLTQSIFIEMFGDPVANPAKWNKLPLAEVVAGKYGVKAGPFGSALKKEEYGSSGYRVYGQEQVIAGRFDVGDYYISERKYEQLKSCSITEGDLLVSLVGSFGKILIVPSGIEPGIINPRLLKISPNRKLLTSEFLAAVLEHPSVQKHFEQVAHGGTMGILNAGLLKQLDVILPPLHLQAAFANRLESATQIALAHKKSLLELDSLFSSLQHRAFRGEL